MTQFRQICLGICGAALLVLIVGLMMQRSTIWQPAAAIAAVTFAIGIGAIPALRGYQFTAWILAAVVCPMIYPERFLHPGGPDGINMRNPWIILAVIQLVMFGMGTQMSLKDFAGVAKMPYGVFVGLLSQFTIMPLVGYGLTKLFHFENPEIAAGIILIGACSSGLASNVMNYLAKANLALSITLTAFNTLLAPVLTPLWMKLLAGQMIPVDFYKMMMEIIKMVIVPIGAAMLSDYLRHAAPGGRRFVYGIACCGVCWLLLHPLGCWLLLQKITAGMIADPGVLSVQAITISITSFLFFASIAGVLYYQLTERFPAVSKFMPLFSMAGIVYFTAVTTAAGRNELLAIGGMLLLAAMLHNTFGYFLGYWMARGFGLSRNDARTIAFEVGLQNGGMASGLAAWMGKLGTVGLAAAIFSPWMNISGSILANYWRKRPVDTESPKV